MGVDFMIMTVTSRQRMFDAETFLREAQHRWPGCSALRLDHQGGRFADAAANIKPGTSPSFSVRHFPDDRMVSTDAEPYTAAEVAVWVRSVHPDPDLVLWYVDEMFNSHVVLHPGITTDQIHSSWVDHTDHDPYTEYPQYFH